MQNLIKDGALSEDNWTLLPKDFTGELPSGPAIVPLQYWLSNKASLGDTNQVGVWIDSDEEPEALESDCQNLQLIAINFPAFRDGRGYSFARLLRDRYGYQGELRAIGDVLRDQLFYLKRCGFNAFAIREDRSAEEALAGLSDFSDAYQAASDQPIPYFRRRA